MNKTYNIIWNAARGMYIVTSELARSGSRAIVSVSASCAVTLLAMDAALPSQRKREFPFPPRPPPTPCQALRRSSWKRAIPSPPT